MERSKFIVASKSKVLFYAVGFTSFSLVVFFMEQIRTRLEEYISNKMLLVGGTYLVAYILAIYLIPMILFWVVAQVIER